MSSDMSATGIDARLRALRIIWAAILGTVFLYGAFGYFKSPPIFSWRAGFAGEDGSAALGLAAGGLYLAGLLAAVLASQLVLRSFLRRAEAEQNPALVQTGFIAAFVVCEAGALIGLVVLFITRSWLAFLLMAVSAMMVAILFPRRGQVAAAGYKT